MEQNIQPASTQKVSPLEQTVSVGEWLITLLLASIPVVNIVMLLIWAFSENTKLSKANWAKATLIWLIIVVAFYFVLIVGSLGFISRFGR